MDPLGFLQKALIETPILERSKVHKWQKEKGKAKNKRKRESEWKRGREKQNTKEGEGWIREKG